MSVALEITDKQNHMFNTTTDKLQWKGLYVVSV